MLFQLGIDDFKYVSDSHNFEQEMHGWSRIHEAHYAIAVTSQIAQRDQRPQTAAVHERRLRELNLNDLVPIHSGMNFLPKHVCIGGGQLYKCSKR